jgi:hypothetical protein
MRPDQEFKALANCHAKGLFSIPLEQSSTYVRRMFIDTLGQCHTVAPHSHRYPLELHMVEGRMTHTLWYEDPMGPFEMYEYRWLSPILVDITTVKDLEPVKVEAEPGRFERLADSATRYSADSSRLSGTSQSTLGMKAQEIHSLVTRPGTCWIITEYQDQNENPLTLHSTPNYAPDTSGLYVPIGV